MLMYADDTVILARSRRELIEKLNIFKWECKSIGLEVNESKSEVMVVGEKKKEQFIEGIEVKDSIKYLGVWMDKNGSLTKTVRERVEKCKRMRGFINYMVSGRKRKMELGRIIWKGVVIPAVVFGLAATGGDKVKMEELEREQRKFGRGMLEVPRSTPSEFIDMEMGWSSQRERIEKARLKVAKRMVERRGKARESMVKGWKEEGRWIKEVKENLRRNEIGEGEFEEMDWKEIEKRINKRRKKDWWEGVNKKTSLRWYGRWREKDQRMVEWESSKEDRIQKRYWSGTMEYRIGKEKNRCTCIRGRKEEEVEHLVKRCSRTEEWRWGWEI